MVARGDLGVEMDLAQVPVVQKRLVAKADEWGKPCIVATQMLESMIASPTPTRAEVSDVANAVLDGADAVMLSGETAVGKHPVLAVEMMRRTIAATEERVRELPQQESPPARLLQSGYRTAALAHGAWHAARDIGARAVACWSQRGGTARYLSQNGFRVPILAYSSDKRETRRMVLCRGVSAVYAPEHVGGAGKSLAAWNRRVEDDLLARGWVKPGEPVVLLAGWPLGEHGSTSAMAVHYVGNPATGFMRDD
jgi:pyruvate kinase